MDWSAIHAFLRLHGVELAPGLNDVELARAEDRVGCRFPPDLRSFLQSALPLKDGLWPDWRQPDSEDMAYRLGWAEQGMVFDLEHCQWWPPPWGSRPSALSDAIALAREKLRKVPKIIPIFSHRFLPAKPCEAGNPVLSVYQMVDTIYYGSDLNDYFDREINCDLRGREPIGPVRPIRFWREVVEEWYKNPADAVMTAAPDPVA